jgi:hypothetical protein
MNHATTHGELKPIQTMFFALKNGRSHFIFILPLLNRKGDFMKKTIQSCFILMLTVCLLFYHAPIRSFAQTSSESGENALAPVIQQEKPREYNAKGNLSGKTQANGKGTSSISLKMIFPMKPSCIPLRFM